LGLVSALVAGIFLSLWVVGGSVASKRNISPITIKYFETSVMLVLILLFYPFLLLFPFPSSLVALSLNHSLFLWGLLIVFNLFIITLGHMIYFSGSKYIPTASSGIILLLEPITGVLLSVVFLYQPLTAGVIIGGLFILAGNYLVVTKS
jgi:drug/metabolite transporter (DMT)-like permease